MGLGFGTAMGFANGWLVAKVKLPPFIVTLGNLADHSGRELYLLGQ